MDVNIFQYKRKNGKQFLRINFPSHFLITIVTKTCQATVIMTSDPVAQV